MPTQAANKSGSGSGAEHGCEFLWRELRDQLVIGLPVGVTLSAGWAGAPAGETAAIATIAMSKTRRRWMKR